MKMTRRNFLSASALTLLSCQLAPAARADCLLSGLFHGADTALPPKPLTAKVVDANPFMGRSESNIHHDCYNTDSTDAVLPVGICPEVNVAMEKTNPNASPAIFFDNFDNPVSPFLGGLAIRDLDAEEVRTIGFFSPAKHDGGVEVVWRTPYDSVGAKDSREGAATTGGGLAWGGGCSPSLSRELVFFTDNLETVSLMAVDIHTGEVAASHPVIDELPANMPVSVENSAIVYDHGNGRVSTIVCNWFGAGSPNLAKPDSDSSIQSYENIYDRNWLLKGNCMIMPGVERVDTIRTADGWTMKSIWCRSDLSDTSMMKLSTATGYIYGFVQDVDSGMWQYIVLDFDTGKTVLTVDVASLYGYNNMAIGMYAGRDGNKLYCPTGYKELLRLQDRFVFLPEMPYRKVDLDKTSRRVLSAAEFQAAGGAGTPASWLHTATLDNLHPATTVSFRINGLTGNAADYKLFALGTDGRYHEVSDWHFDDAPARLSAKKVYTICLTAQDGGSFDLSPDAKEVTLSVVLAR